MTTRDEIVVAIAEFEEAVTDVCYSRWAGNGPKRQRVADARAHLLDAIAQDARPEPVGAEITKEMIERAMLAVWVPTLRDADPGLYEMVKRMLNAALNGGGK